jgi:drug/metabolite transporter (DMT)-like permease
MAPLLALLSALSYGIGDFCGGLASRRLPPAAVVLRANAAGLVALVALLPVVSGVATARDLGIGLVAGTAGAIAVLLFFHGLSTGAMSVIAPITAVLSAVVPVAVGMAGGERPSVVALVGIPLALLAVALLAREPGGGTTVTGLTTSQFLCALGAGLGFGLFFVGLDATGEDAGLWPVVAGRVASVSVMAGLALVRPAVRVGDHRARWGTTPLLLVTCGVLDGLANALFLGATREGMLTLVAVITALYPAATLAMARTVLGERLARPQLGGAALACAAVVLVTAG